MISAVPVITLLRIEPLHGGWVLTCAQNELAQIFRSGAEAERQARRQAKALARCGYAPRLAIRDRSGGMIKAKL